MRAKGSAGLILALLVLAACGASVGGSDPEPPADDAGGGPLGPVDAANDVSPASEASADAPIDASVDAPIDASEAGPDSGLPATVTPGAADRIMLLGTVVTPDVSFD